MWCKRIRKDPGTTCTGVQLLCLPLDSGISCKSKPVLTLQSSELRPQQETPLCDFSVARPVSSTSSWRASSRSKSSPQSIVYRLSGSRSLQSPTNGHPCDPHDAKLVTSSTLAVHGAGFHEASA